MSVYVHIVDCPDAAQYVGQCQSLSNKVYPLHEVQPTTFSLPEITASQAVELCGAIALLLGVAWVFKQVARAILHR